MLVDNNNNFSPVVTVIDNEDKTLTRTTTDNVDLDKTYRLIYKLDDINKVYSYKAAGGDMLFSFMKWANAIAQDINTTDLNAIRHVLTSYVCLFATRQISKSEYKKVRKDYPPDTRLLVKNAVKDKNALQTAHEFIEAYMYLKHIGADINETVLHVTDRKADIYATDEILKNWEDSPLAKRGDVRTPDEFLEMWKAGSLTTDWGAEQ